MTIYQFAETMNGLFLDFNGGGMLDDYTMENCEEHDRVLFHVSNENDAEFLWNALVGAAHLCNEMYGSEIRVARIKEMVAIYEEE
jgi:hypothetical protein